MADLQLARPEIFSSLRAGVTKSTCGIYSGAPTRVGNSTSRAEVQRSKSMFIDPSLGNGTSRAEI
jgi:hypothetical protein